MGHQVPRGIGVVIMAADDVIVEGCTIHDEIDAGEARPDYGARQ